MITAHRAIVLMALPAMALLLTGCFSRQPKYLVPDMPNALEQYEYAQRFSLKQAQIPTSQRDRQYPAVIHAYKAVIERFPEDKVVTPVDYIAIGDLYYAMGDYKQAMSYYSDSLEKYPRLDHIRAEALLSLGKTWQQRNRLEKARDTYKQVIDLFAGHPRRSVQTNVEEARELYNKVYAVE